MTTFRDATDRPWRVEIDAFVLGQLRDECQIDLADVSAAGYVALELDVVSLVRALQVICREQLAAAKVSPRDFAKVIAGEAIDRACEAVRGAAADFFPPARWSKIRSRWTQRLEAAATWETIQPMMALLNRPDVPAQFRDAVMEVVGGQLTTLVATDSPPSTASPSASGPAEIPPSTASTSPASSVSAPAA
jgi:hypothetical protein